MSKSELIAGCIVAFMIISGILYNSHMTELCKIEALKAGKSADDIRNICGR